MKALTFLSNLSDRDLLEAATRLAHEERCATTELIAALAEVDARRLYLGAGCSSLFTYCVQVLHLSEHAAYGRIEAARAARRYPIILDALAQGLLTLTTVTLLAPHLTEANYTAVLASAHGKSKRDVEQLVATLRPRPDAPAIVRKLSPPRLPAERAIAAPHAGEMPSVQPSLNDGAPQRKCELAPFRRPSSEPSGSGMEAGVLTSEHGVAARRPDFSNTTTSSRSHGEERPPPTTSNSDAGHTTSTKRGRRSVSAATCSSANALELMPFALSNASTLSTRKGISTATMVVTIVHETAHALTPMSSDPRRCSTILREHGSGAQRTGWTCREARAMP